MWSRRRLIAVVVACGAAAALIAVRVTIASGHSSPSHSAGALASPSTPTSASKLYGLSASDLSEPPIPPAVLPSTPIAGTTPGPTSRAKQLALLAFSCSGDALSITCTGSVENLTDHPLKNVVAMVEYHDENLALVNRDAAAIGDTSFLPGQTSSWTVVGGPNPNYIYERVLFVDLATDTMYTLEDDTG